MAEPTYSSFINLSESPSSPAINVKDYGVTAANVRDYGNIQSSPLLHEKYDVGNALGTNTVPIKSSLNLDVNNTTPWYKDGQTLQGYAGLASSLANLGLMVPQIKAYKQNLKESEHNMARAKIAAERKDDMYKNINSVG